jgi:hypothetical protein
MRPMWRFLVISFAALGMSFYVLSGGADYAPVENSIQVQGLPSRAAPQPASDPDSPQRVAEEARQQTVAEVEAMMERMGEAEEETDEIALTLAQVNRDAFSIIQSEADRPKAELLTMELPEQMVALPEPDPETETETENAAATAPETLSSLEAFASAEPDPSIDAAIAAAIGQVVATPDTLRWVKEDVVNLRTGPGLTFERVTQLRKGTEVAILEDPGNGWLNVQEVDGYNSGWVAEWLLMMPEE